MKNMIYDSYILSEFPNPNTVSTTDYNKKILGLKDTLRFTKVKGRLDSPKK